MLIPTFDAPPAIKRPLGRPRKRAVKLYADKAYDAAALHWALRCRGIIPWIAPWGVEFLERLGRYRWVIERSGA